MGKLGSKPRSQTPGLRDSVLEAGAAVPGATARRPEFPRWGAPPGSPRSRSLNRPAAESGRPGLARVLETALHTGTRGVSFVGR